MLGELKETPTRYELLNMVKKHSKLLGKTIANEDDDDDEINPCFWHDVMDLYFIRGRETRDREDDGLVFFVRKIVLKDADHCYCVLLNADGGAAFPNEREDCSSSDISFLKINTSSAKSKQSKLSLFSGFVSYLMVQDAYGAGKSGFRTLFSLARSPGKTDRIYMKGPGGRGEVEVAVSGVIDLSKRDSGCSSLAFTRGFSIGKIVHTAASVASVAAKQAHMTAASTRGSDEAMLPLKCCLISIPLPWEHIAYALLLKGSPPVNL